MSGVIIHIGGIYISLHLSLTLPKYSAWLTFLMISAFLPKKSLQNRRITLCLFKLACKGHPFSSDELSLVDLQVYHLSSVRLRDLCTKLDVHEELRLK